MDLIIVGLYRIHKLIFTSSKRPSLKLRLVVDYIAEALRPVISGVLRFNILLYRLIQPRHPMPRCWYMTAACYRFTNVVFDFIVPFSATIKNGNCWT